MESIISDQLSDYLSLNGLISKEQHGFLVKRSTGTQLLECFQDWFLEIHNKKAIDIVYIDYSRAFDSLVHSKLLIKLSSYGISHELFGWIKCFLEGRTQSVSIDGHVSTPLDVVSGVVQGSNLGPLLFILFINDIVDIISGPSKCKLFADDLKLYSSVALEVRC